MARGWSRGRADSADELLIRRLYEEHGGALLAYATKLTGDRASGEDVFQETMIRAWRNQEALLNNKGSLRGYLLTIARHVVIDRHRARQARPAEVAESAATTPQEPDHADAVVDAMLVADALQTLTPEGREVLMHLRLHGRSVKETAEILGVPEGTVKSRSSNALKKLRENFAQPPERTPPPVAAPDPVVAEGAAG
jgi:RNA polymerase sigma-70 factor, ECF subfamily